jgi:hypothetical protein
VRSGEAVDAPGVAPAVVAVGLEPDVAPALVGAAGVAELFPFPPVLLEGDGVPGAEVLLVEVVVELVVGVVAEADERWREPPDEPVGSWPVNVR